jgi:hypothetical protein
MSGRIERLNQINKIIEQLQGLAAERERLVRSPLAPPGVWIHQYEIRKQYKKGGDVYWYVYAKWQANEPIFKRSPKERRKGIVKKGKNPEYTCHQHIGRVGSSTGLPTDEEVKEAYREWYNRQRLDTINTAIAEIEKLLERVTMSGLKRGVPLLPRSDADDDSEKVD